MTQEGKNALYRSAHAAGMTPSQFVRAAVHLYCITTQGKGQE